MLYRKALVLKSYQRTADIAGQMIVVLSGLESVDKSYAIIAYAGAYFVTVSYEYAIDVVFMQKFEKIALGLYRVIGFIAEAEIIIELRSVKSDRIKLSRIVFVALACFGKSKGIGRNVEGDERRDRVTMAFLELKCALVYQLELIGIYPCS